MDSLVLYFCPAARLIDDSVALVASKITFEHSMIVSPRRL